MSRYSGQSRVGLSGSQATSWVSDTWVVCKTAAGVDGTMRLSMTTGERVGSATEAASYDLSSLSSVVSVNEGTTAGGSLTVIGADLGASR